MHSYGRLKSLIRGKDSKAAMKVLKELLMEEAAHVNFFSDELLARMMEGEGSDGAVYVASSAESGDDSLQDSSDGEAQQAHYNAIANIGDKSPRYSVSKSLSAEGSSGNDIFFSGSMNCRLSTEKGQENALSGGEIVKDWPECHPALEAVFWLQMGGR